MTLKQRKRALRASSVTRGAKWREDESFEPNASNESGANKQQRNWMAMKTPPRSPSHAGQQRAPRPQKQPMQERARPPPLPVLVDHADLRALFGIKYSRVHIWRLIRAGKFPPPVSLYDGGGGRKASVSVGARRTLSAWVANSPTPTLGTSRRPLKKERLRAGTTPREAGKQGVYDDAGADEEPTITPTVEAAGNPRGDSLNERPHQSSRDPQRSRYLRRRRRRPTVRPRPSHPTRDTPAGMIVGHYRPDPGESLACNPTPLHIYPTWCAYTPGSRAVDAEAALEAAVDAGGGRASCRNTSSSCCDFARGLAWNLIPDACALSRDGYGRGKPVSTHLSTVQVDAALLQRQRR